MRRKLALSAALGLGVAAALAAPVTSAVAAPAGSEVISAYEGSSAESKMDRAFFEMIMEKAQAKQDAKPGIQAVTVTYNAGSAPTFSSEISSSTSIWNGAVNNVSLAATSGAGDFEYREGNDPRGSYAYTDGHGSGYIFLDYAQNEQYDSLRVTAHETGHVLGLPDNYSGPCSELMSGGGPGPSCTNAQPNAAESAQVDALWANGLG
jgi:snapalysin